MALRPLDVIWFYDTDVDPAKWKRVVCICPLDGLFYRINSNDDFPIGVLIPRDPHHVCFLKWDSYIECGKYPIELDDYQIQKALDANGGTPIGRVNSAHAPQICAAVQLQSTIPKVTKNLIFSALGC